MLKYVFKKDMQLLLSDKKSFVFLILMPVILSGILGAALSSMFEGNPMGDGIKLAVVKDYRPSIETDSPLDLDEIFIEGMLESEGIKEIMSYEVMSKEASEQGLESGDIDVAMILPNDFLTKTEDLLFGIETEPATIDLVIHPEKESAGNIVRQVMAGFNQRLIRNQGIQNQLVASGNIHLLQESDTFDLEVDLLTEYKTVSNKKLVTATA